jgi:hypothetical protein
MWFKFGRFISGLTIACFFLPFFGVSCKGPDKLGDMDVVTFSGADMVGGCTPGGLISEANKQSGADGSMREGDPMSKMDVSKTPRQPLAIIALVLALGVFALAWVRSRKAMTGAAVLSVACLGALIGLWLKVGGDLKNDIADYKNKDGAGGEFAAQMTKDTELEAGPRMGLYATCLSLLAGAALCGLALKEPEGTELQEG